MTDKPYEELALQTPFYVLVKYALSTSTLAGPT